MLLFNETFHCKQRFIAIFSIGIVCISIGAISKKVISYRSGGGCMIGAQELSFKKEINNLNIMNVF